MAILETIYKKDHRLVYLQKVFTNYIYTIYTIYIYIYIYYIIL